jgi:prepilin-type N-terminal cleavage/methylation domain-containing protein
MIARRPTKSPSTSHGFTLLEMMCATVIMLTAMFAVAQLVPASVLLNSRNRSDSSALVFAQRELDQMLEQPLGLPSFQDAQGTTCNLGDPTNPNAVVGNAVVVINNLATIDFSGVPIPGYSFSFLDPTSANGATLDVRWAVITSVNAGTGIVTGKRFILGVRQQGGNGYFLPITLDSTVAK